MRNFRIALLALGVTAPVLLVLAQATRMETFERNLRPHVSGGKFGGSFGSSHFQKRDFSINGIQYRTIITENLLDAEPDWAPGQALPLGTDKLEEIARRELVRLVTNDAPWSVTSFQLNATPAASGIKWYFAIEMQPFWNASHGVPEQRQDSFQLVTDITGRPGFIGVLNGQTFEGRR